MSTNFRYQPFMAVSGNLGGKVTIVDDVLSSHEQEYYLTASLVENCVEFKFQTDRNSYVDLRQSFLALNLKFVKGRVYDTDDKKEKKRSTTMTLLFSSPKQEQAMRKKKKKKKKK